MQNLVSSVQEERAKYGATMTDDECAALCNAVAWKHRADGWGTSRKTSGARGRLPNGTEIAHDILHHRPTNELIDVLIAAGAASQPQWVPVGPPQSSDRTWVAPIDPATWQTPVQPPVAAAPPLATAAEAAEILEAIAALRQDVERLHARVNAGWPLRIRAGFLGVLTGTVGRE